MIFVTVGAQMPFDRLVAAMDRWAGDHQDAEVFAQVGNTRFVPEHVQWATRLQPGDFRRRMQEAHLVVSHAGMGSILTALEFNTPILVLPRSGALRETRNDHQMATARWLSDNGRVAVATDEHELLQKLNDLRGLAAPGQIARWASDTLIATVRDFILQP